MALAAIAEPADLDELISMLKDPSWGGTKSAFVRSLAKIGGFRAQAALSELKNDPDLGSDIAAVWRIDMNAEIESTHQPS